MSADNGVATFNVKAFQRRHWNYGEFGKSGVRALFQDETLNCAKLSGSGEIL